MNKFFLYEEFLYKARQAEDIVDEKAFLTLYAECLSDLRLENPDFEQEYDQWLDSPPEVVRAKQISYEMKASLYGIEKSYDRLNHLANSKDVDPRARLNAKLYFYSLRHAGIEAKRTLLNLGLEAGSWGAEH